jgi:hypothetical protein
MRYEDLTQYDRVACLYEGQPTGGIVQEIEGMLVTVKVAKNSAVAAGETITVPWSDLFLHDEMEEAAA